MMKKIFQILRTVDVHERAYRSVPFGEGLIKEMVACSALSIPMSTTGAMTAYR